MKLKKIIACFVCVLVFSTNCLLTYANETNIWKERRKSLQLASLLPALPHRGDAPSLNAYSKPVSVDLHRAAPAGFESVVRSLPVSLGTVRGIRHPKQGASAKIVLLVQDIHMNAEAQKNISDALAALNRTIPLDFIGLEGARGEINLAPYRNYPRQDTVVSVADYLLENNKISGAAHAAVFFPSARVFGVEDPLLYRKNVDAYKKAAPYAEVYRRRLVSFESKLMKAGRSAMNPELASFDALVRSYQDKETQIASYLEELSVYAPLSSELIRFLTAVRLEKNIDYGKVERERTALLNDLSPKLTQVEISSLFEKGLAYRLSNATPYDFYRYLSGLAESKGLSLRRYPSLGQYLTYVGMADAIVGETVFRDIKDGEEKGYRRLARSGEEKRIIGQLRLVRAMRKLLVFSLTAEEWRDYLRLKKTFSTPPLENIGFFEDFYSNAELRNDAMASRLIRAAGKKDAAVGVLVIGGFHASDVIPTLNASGFTTVSFVPKITKVSGKGSENYLSIFTQQKTPLEKLVAGEKLFLASDPVAGWRLFPPLSRLVEIGRSELGRRMSGAFKITIDSARGAVDVIARLYRKSDDLNRAPRIDSVASEARRTIWSFLPPAPKATFASVAAPFALITDSQFPSLLFVLVLVASLVLALISMMSASPFNWFSNEPRKPSKRPGLKLEALEDRAAQTSASSLDISVKDVVAGVEKSHVDDLFGNFHLDASPIVAPPAADLNAVSIADKLFGSVTEQFQTLLNQTPLAPLLFENRLADRIFTQEPFVNLDVNDLSDVTYSPRTGTYFAFGRKSDLLYEFDSNGTRLRTIDVSALKLSGETNANILGGAYMYGDKDSDTIAFVQGNSEFLRVAKIHRTGAVELIGAPVKLRGNPQAVAYLASESARTGKDTFVVVNGSQAKKELLKVRIDDIAVGARTYLYEIGIDGFIGAGETPTGIVVDERISDKFPVIVTDKGRVIQVDINQVATPLVAGEFTVLGSLAGVTFDGDRMRLLNDSNLLAFRPVPALTVDAPVAVLDGPITVFNDAPGQSKRLTLDASESHDPNGAIFFYEWFVNGERVSFGAGKPGVQNLTRDFSPGVNDVELVLYGYKGQIRRASTSVDVKDLVTPPSTVPMSISRIVEGAARFVNGRLTRYEYEDPFTSLRWKVNFVYDQKSGRLISRTTTREDKNVVYFEETITYEYANDGKISGFVGHQYDQNRVRVAIRGDVIARGPDNYVIQVTNQFGKVLEVIKVIDRGDTLREHIYRGRVIDGKFLTADQIFNRGFAPSEMRTSLKPKDGALEARATSKIEILIFDPSGKKVLSVARLNVLYKSEFKFSSNDAKDKLKSRALRNILKNLEDDDAIKYPKAGGGVKLERVRSNGGRSGGQRNKPLQFPASGGNGGLSPVPVNFAGPFVEDPKARIPRLPDEPGDVNVPTPTDQPRNELVFPDVPLPTIPRGADLDKTTNEKFDVPKEIPAAEALVAIAKVLAPYFGAAALYVVIFLLAAANEKEKEKRDVRAASSETPNASPSPLKRAKPKWRLWIGGLLLFAVMLSGVWFAKTSNASVKKAVDRPTASALVDPGKKATEKKVAEEKENKEAEIERNKTIEQKKAAVVSLKAEIEKMKKSQADLRSIGALNAEIEKLSKDLKSLDTASLKTKLEKMKKSPFVAPAKLVPLESMGEEVKTALERVDAQERPTVCAFIRDIKTGKWVYYLPADQVSRITLVGRLSAEQKTKFAGVLKGKDANTPVCVSQKNLYQVYPTVKLSTNQNEVDELEAQIQQTERDRSEVEDTIDVKQTQLEKLQTDLGFVPDDDSAEDLDARLKAKVKELNDVSASLDQLQNDFQPNDNVDDAEDEVREKTGIEVPSEPTDEPQAQRPQEKKKTDSSWVKQYVVPASATLAVLLGLDLLLRVLNKKRGERLSGWKFRFAVFALCLATLGAGLYADRQASSKVSSDAPISIVKQDSPMGVSRAPPAAGSAETKAARQELDRQLTNLIADASTLRTAIRDGRIKGHLAEGKPRAEAERMADDDVAPLLKDNLQKQKNIEAQISELNNKAVEDGNEKDDVASNSADNRPFGPIFIVAVALVSFVFGFFWTVSVLIARVWRWFAFPAPRATPIVLPALKPVSVESTAEVKTFDVTIEKSKKKGRVRRVRTPDEDSSMQIRYRYRKGLLRMATITTAFFKPAKVDKQSLEFDYDPNDGNKLIGFHNRPQRELNAIFLKEQSTDKKPSSVVILDASKKQRRAARLTYPSNGKIQFEIYGPKEVDGRTVDPSERLLDPSEPADATRTIDVNSKMPIDQLYRDILGEVSNDLDLKLEPSIVGRYQEFNDKGHPTKVVVVNSASKDKPSTTAIYLRAYSYDEDGGIAGIEESVYRPRSIKAGKFAVEGKKGLTPDELIQNGMHPTEIFSYGKPLDPANIEIRVPKEWRLWEFDEEGEIYGSPIVNRYRLAEGEIKEKDDQKEDAAEIPFKVEHRDTPTPDAAPHVEAPKPPRRWHFPLWLGSFFIPLAAFPVGIFNQHNITDVSNIAGALAVAVVGGRIAWFSIPKIPIVKRWTATWRIVREHYVVNVDGVSLWDISHREESAIENKLMSRIEWWWASNHHSLSFLFTIPCLIVTILALKTVIYATSLIFPTHRKAVSIASAAGIHYGYNVFWYFLLRPIEIFGKTFLFEFYYMFGLKRYALSETLFDFFISSRWATPAEAVDYRAQTSRKELKFGIPEGPLVDLIKNYLKSRGIEYDKEYQQKAEKYPLGYPVASIYKGHIKRAFPDSEYSFDFERADVKPEWEFALQREELEANRIKPRIRGYEPHEAYEPGEAIYYLEVKNTEKIARKKMRFPVKADRLAQILSWNDAEHPSIDYTVLNEPFNALHRRYLRDWIKLNKGVKPLIIVRYERIAWEEPSRPGVKASAGLRMNLDFGVRYKRFDPAKHADDFVADKEGFRLTYDGFVKKGVGTRVLEIKYAGKAPPLWIMDFLREITIAGGEEAPHQGYSKFADSVIRMDNMKESDPRLLGPGTLFEDYLKKTGFVPDTSKGKYLKSKKGWSITGFFDAYEVVAKVSDKAKIVPADYPLEPGYLADVFGRGRPARFDSKTGVVSEGSYPRSASKTPGSLFKKLFVFAVAVFVISFLCWLGVNEQSHLLDKEFGLSRILPTSFMFINLYGFGQVTLGGIFAGVWLGQLYDSAHARPDYNADFPDMLRELVPLLSMMFFLVQHYWLMGAFLFATVAFMFLRTNIRNVLDAVPLIAGIVVAFTVSIVSSLFSWLAVLLLLLVITALRYLNLWIKLDVSDESGGKGAKSPFDVALFIDYLGSDPKKDAELLEAILIRHIGARKSEFVAVGRKKASVEFDLAKRVRRDPNIGSVSGLRADLETLSGKFKFKLINRRRLEVDRFAYIKFVPKLTANAAVLLILLGSLGFAGPLFAGTNSVTPLIQFASAPNGKVEINEKRVQKVLALFHQAISDLKRNKTIDGRSISQLLGEPENLGLSYPTQNLSGALKNEEEKILKQALSRFSAEPLSREITVRQLDMMLKRVLSGPKSSGNAGDKNVIVPVSGSDVDLVAQMAKTFSTKKIVLVVDAREKETLEVALAGYSNIAYLPVAAGSLYSFTPEGRTLNMLSLADSLGRVPDDERSNYRVEIPADAYIYKPDGYGLKESNLRHFSTSFVDAGLDTVPVTLEHLEIIASEYRRVIMAQRQA